MVSNSLHIYRPIYYNVVLPIDLLWTNPQFRIALTAADEDATDGKCTVIVSLMQKTEDQSLDLSINYQVYKVSCPVLVR